MKVSEQIKILCLRNNIPVSELGKRLGKTPQAFSAKVKREKFSVEELEEIAKVTGCQYYHYFKLPNGDIIK